MQKRLLYYFLYIISIIILLYFGTSYITQLKTPKTYNPYSSMLFNIIFSFLMGLILSLPEFIAKFKRTGNWKINWLRLLIVGIPILFITFSHLLYFSVIGKYLYVILVPWVIETHGVIISGMILGYNIFSSIIKVTD